MPEDSGGGVLETESWRRRKDGGGGGGRGGRGCRILAVINWGSKTVNLSQDKNPFLLIPHTADYISDFPHSY